MSLFVFRDGKNDKKKLVDAEEAGSPLEASASLTPAIWDKTIPYDGETFHLEYMDLDEFLLENGIPASPSQLELNQSVENSLVPVVELEKNERVSTPSSPAMCTATEDPPKDGSKEVCREAANPIDPEQIEVSVNFIPDPVDLILSSVPGGVLFDPRKHKFSEDDLKPQPMIKKAKKIFVPEDAKDDKYWSRRRKNNVAAKRSREARRLKENQITVRAAFLEKENFALRTEVAELRKDVGRCKSIISKYEAKYGPL
ncbi:thyrotroph embryonic factor-like [Protopterus annectens]|uniref:thyrotroph embryonic factor-like n=1 Tax=Protopterus annectens TaxID=7888 RepID=UPI001CF956C7|nr:thyrotroph embryonic factor-like [Protopterus annectens]